MYFFSAVLHKNSIEFNLLTAGSSTTIVKSAAAEWNQLSKARVYEAIQFIDDSTNLADAVLYASTLTGKSASSKSGKTMFIITDGYDSAPKKLEMSLSYAESIGIQTIVLGVGYFTDSFSYFPNYVFVNDPDNLPVALQGFYSGEAAVDVPESKIEYQIEEERLVDCDGEKLTSLEMIWNKKLEMVYEKQVEKTKNALYFAMSPVRSGCNAMSIDLCFVMDTTGSMGCHIDAAKRYVLQMTNDIKRNVEMSSGKTAKLRVAYVSYKNVGNMGHLQNQPFTENVSEVEAVLKTVRSSGGRGDEDKYDGMNLAMSFNWTGTVKFLVLIADMPGYRDRTSYMPALVGKIAANNIHLMYVSIRSSTDAECRDFKRFYLAAAPANMKEKGFMEVNLKNTNDSDKLKDLLIQGIDYIICSEFL